MTRPHVVHVLHSLAVGGTENGVVNLIQALDGEVRHTVVSMTVTGPLAARLPSHVELSCLGKRPGLDLWTVARLTRLFRRLRPDVVHSRNWGTFDAILAARLARVPVVIHGEHGREADDPDGRSRRRNRLRRLAAPFVDRFVAVSHDLHRWLIQVVGIPEGRVMTIHNGVDAHRFRDDDRETGRQALGLPADAVVVGTVGRLDPVKDQLGLLEAFGRLAKTDSRAVLVIVGDGPCREALEARARMPDLAGRVRLYGERHDVPVLLQGLDVFVLTSIAEGISNTILEAMATGVPVVATRTGGNPELVEDAVTGMLVPVGRPEALAEALRAYVTDPHLRALHGKAARQRVLEEFALGRMARRYADLYQALAPARA